jgi:hypothetical protein
MVRRPCLEPGCSALAEPGQARCEPHRKARTRATSRARGTTSSQGYGTDHQKLRRQLLATAVGRLCTRCGQPIQPGQPVDLDHTDDRRGYRGMAHRSCNRAAGGRRGAARRRR